MKTLVEKRQFCRGVAVRCKAVESPGCVENSPVSIQVNHHNVRLRCNRALVISLNAAAISLSPDGPLPEHAALDSLPALDQRHEAHHTAEDKAPLPRERHVSEDDLVDDRDVDDGERRADAGDDGPEQEAILEQGVEDGEGAGVFFGVHVEQAAGQVLGFPGHDAEQDCEDGVCCGSSAEGEVASGVVAVVAVVAEVAVACAVDDDDEAGKTERAHASAINELVDDELFGKDTGAETVRRSCHDI